MLMRVVTTVVIVVVVVAVAGSLPDIKRYLKMRQM
jgi:hypothetical protein